MPNIQFNYLYRDGSNYKQVGCVIFNNPDNKTTETLQKLIQSKLIDGEYFYAADWQLPDLHFKIWDNETDHTFHEFESVEYTSKTAHTLLNLAEFVILIKTTNWVY